MLSISLQLAHLVIEAQIGVNFDGDASHAGLERCLDDRRSVESWCLTATLINGDIRAVRAE